MEQVIELFYDKIIFLKLNDMNPAEQPLIQLANYGFLRIIGQEAKKFLQGQLTCDMEKIPDQAVSLAAQCNSKGRVISLFYLFNKQNNYYLFMRRDMLSLTQAALKKYAIFYKVTIENLSENQFVYAYFGNPAFTSLNLFSLTPEKHLLLSPSPLAEPSFLPAEMWHLAELQQGLATIYPATSALFLPQELNLDTLGAISFHKGCYTGQEIIARLHYKGKLKKKLFLAHLTHSSPPIPGTDVHHYDAESCGVIIDSCPYEKDSYRALLLIDPDHAKSHFLFFDKTYKSFFCFETTK